MPVVRWLHKVWNTLWAIIAVVVLTVVIGSSIIFGVAQLEPTKSYIATRIEKNFSEKYNGVFTIGELDGLIPFRIELKNVNLYPDSSSISSVFSSDSIAANLNVKTYAMLTLGCEWRWSGDKSIWYPDVYLVKQKNQGDWTDVIEKIKNLILLPEELVIS